MTRFGIFRQKERDALYRIYLVYQLLSLIQLISVTFLNVALNKNEIRLYFTS